jgi:hypothetical protein
MGGNGERVYAGGGGLDDEGDELLLEDVLVVGLEVEADDAV